MDQATRHLRCGKWMGIETIQKLVRKSGQSGSSSMPKRVSYKAVFSAHSYFSAEYFLADYLMKVGNFNRDYLDTTMGAEGYYDAYNSDADELKTTNATKIVSFRRSGIASVSETVTDKENNQTEQKFYWYEFSFIPNLGFLADSDPLLPDCELALSFGRTKPEVSVIKKDAGDDLEAIELKHVHAVAEYISSPELRTYFESINQNPIVYNYDDIDVITKQLPLNDTVVRFDNMRGGSIPSHIFAGIIPTASISGDYGKSSTGFQWFGVEEFNITLNGQSCNGFPMVIRQEGSVIPLQQFNDVTGRLLNVEAGSGLTLTKFATNYIWCHRFEAEQTANGWIGIDFKLKERLDFNATLVIWIVSPHAFSIDKYHRIEQVSK